ncbi:TIGR04283 family arsenosugar biosynthesis glycosyltransferase [Halopseudomonas salina]|uniref:TIGR04283 family arsenosugar biosynthesis glycosyltransferase n=1 Tax=Halopseudomonas salina TaxID=1323744 RepID=UPI001CC23DEF|nr:glycosyltransferase family 2 protein [Halopseudomonas salina]
MPWLSVVIPVRNEAPGIVQVLEPLQGLRGEIEIILVDGGSEDATVELAGPLVDQVVESASGRARQMNAGAAVARGAVLLFLHADTRLPEGFLRMIADVAIPPTQCTNPLFSNPKVDPRVPAPSPVIPAHAGNHFDLQPTPSPEPDHSAHPNPTMDPRVREDDVGGESGVPASNPVIPAHAGIHFDLGPASHQAPQYQWGRFDVCLVPSSPTLKMVAWMMNHRSRLTGICTGDQAIFVRRDLFNKLGGYADIPLMEDIELTRRLKRICPPARIRHPLTTSSRRWQQNGVFKTIGLMWWLRLQYWVGVSPARLAQKYYPARVPKP